MTDPQTDNPIILFLHIPKTGGTTLLKILTIAYGVERSLRVGGHSSQGNFEEVGRILREHPYDYDMISSHMAKVGVHVHSLRPYWYVSTLREPGARAISRYYHILRRPKHHRHETFTQQITDIEEAIVALGSNLQTRMLAGKDADDTPVTREHLEQAKRNLEDLFVVPFLIERYDEGLLLLKQRLGWERVYRVPPRNVGQNKPRQIPDSLLKLARDTNDLDVELYAFANDLFDRMIADAGSAYQLERRSLAMQSAVRGMWHRIKDVVSPTEGDED